METERFSDKWKNAWDSRKSSNVYLLHVCGFGSTSTGRVCRKDAGLVAYHAQLTDDKCLVGCGRNGCIARERSYNIQNNM